MNNKNEDDRENKEYQQSSNKYDSVHQIYKTYVNKWDGI